MSPFLLYSMGVVVLAFMLIVGGLDFVTTFAAVIACINSAVPGQGMVGPATKYASLSDYET